MNADGSNFWLPLVEKIKYKVSAASIITLSFLKILSEITSGSQLRKHTNDGTGKQDQKFSFRHELDIKQQQCFFIFCDVHNYTY